MTVEPNAAAVHVARSHLGAWSNHVPQPMPAALRQALRPVLHELARWGMRHLGPRLPDDVVRGRRLLEVAQQLRWASSIREALRQPTEARR